MEIYKPNSSEQNLTKTDSSMSKQELQITEAIPMDEGKRKKIEVPPGRLAVERGNEPNSLGIIRFENRRLEFFIGEELEDNLDLMIKNESGSEKIVYQLLVNYNERTGRHEGVLVSKDMNLIASLTNNPDFENLIDRYIEKFQSLGRGYFAKRDRESNNHRIKTHTIEMDNEEREVELVHQIQAGDCGLANYLNTWSIEHDGHVPFTITEARQIAINMRRQKGERVDDILSPDSPLDYKDIINLFSSIYGVEPQQEDILTLEGRNVKANRLKEKILDVLEYLDTYPSGLCTTGMGYHSRTIKKLMGFPDTAIEFFSDETKQMDYDEQRILTEGLSHFFNFRMSKEHSDEELAVLVKWNKLILKYAPKLFDELYPPEESARLKKDVEQMYVKKTKPELSK